MMIVDKILEWARGRGYTAVYGSAGQINEMLTDVDFAASKDATAVVMHLVTDSATVDGKDTAVVAVYFASLCDLDFDGESLLPEQERLKGIGKELLNSIRTGNEMTYSDPRWQYGYDDYAENVCWVCLRVTLTASAADCVPLVIPKPPAPANDYMYFEALEHSTVKMVSTLETAPDLEYSTDGETWQEWQHTTADGTHTFETLMIEEGDRVYLRGDNPNGLAEVGAGEYVFFSSFSMAGKIKAGGNIMSLLDKTMALIEIPDSGLAALFGDVVGETPNTALVAAPDMSHVLKVGKFGCIAMFFKCINLVSAAPMDELTEIGEGGCSAMYTICTSLYSAADMPALTIIRDGGCESMYNGCTSLSSAAAIPLVNSIGSYGCSNMYDHCTSLTSAADMPQLTTIGDGGCESMYNGCTSLTSAADMPQLTTIGDYGCSNMYNDCTFAMSNDGTTLNFAFPSPPITTAGEYPQTYSTAYDIAEWMGNTNGF